MIKQKVKLTKKDILGILCCVIILSLVFGIFIWYNVNYDKIKAKYNVDNTTNTTVVVKEQKESQ